MDIRIKIVRNFAIWYRDFINKLVLKIKNNKIKELLFKSNNIINSTCCEYCNKVFDKDFYTAMYKRKKKNKKLNRKRGEKNV